MMLNEVTKAAGHNPRRKRVGRGESSGHGKTCTRGTKGAQSRAGGLVRPLREGGQMPVFRRLPKRGFSNYNFRIAYHVVNLNDLEQHFAAGQTVDAAGLHGQGLLTAENAFLKILGDGTLTKKLTVVAHAFSQKARTAIEQAGGSVQVLMRPDPAEQAKAKRNTRKSERAGRKASAPS